MNLKIRGIDDETNHDWNYCWSSISPIFSIADPSRIILAWLYQYKLLYYGSPTDPLFTLSRYSEGFF